MINKTAKRAARVAALVGAMTLAISACAGTADNESEGGGATETVRIGYIPSSADASQLLAAVSNGYFEEAGINAELTPFQTGISMSNALTGASIDIGVMGAVAANFPAKGQGKVFVLNNIQADTQQLWANPGTGIESIEDLAGKQVATTSGSAANIMLQVSLESVGLSLADVEVVNLDMPSVANTFVTGGVPAAAMWIPFDEQVKSNAPDATLLAIGSDVDLRLTGGWVANNEYFNSHRESLVKLAGVWQKANTDLTDDTEATLAKVCEQLTEFMEPAVCERVYLTTTAYTNAEWAEMYEDGTIVEWVGEVQRIFETIGVVTGSTLTSADYVDTEIFLEALGSSD